MPPCFVHGSLSGIDAIANLIKEGALGAALTGLMVLLFLRDWRTAFIVVINIPLALWVTKQTINIMTLGGLALAVGILVDEATVAVENIHTHLARGASAARAALAATTETAAPRLLAMLCVLAVFVPAFFMVGAARALFVPLSLAVGFSMIASYLLSSTLVPILSIWLLRKTHPITPSAAAIDQSSIVGSSPSALPEPKETAFTRFQESYARLMHRVIRLRWGVLALYLGVTPLVILLIFRQLGTEIFPKVEAGQLALRLRAPTGTRVERTEAIALEVLDLIKKEVGPENVAITLGFVGTHAPSYPISNIHLWNGGPEQGVVQVQLKRGANVRMTELKERLRQTLAAQLPEVQLSFEPSDIVSRVMSLGAPTPIEVAVSGPNLAANREFAEKIRENLAKVSALRDLQFGQALDYPTVDVAVNRERAGLMGVKTVETSRSLVAATSSSRFTTPVYWADPNSGVAYQVQVQIPQARMSSLEEVKNIRVAQRDGKAILLRSIATVTNGTTVGQYDRYNMQRMITLTANIENADLGRVSKQVRQAIKDLGEPPSKVNVVVRGQMVPMEQMLEGLQTGLLLTVVVIFLLLAANFQSLKLSLIVVSTVPAVIAGVALTLWLTDSTLNIQSFMGAIMAVGVAVANAILLVTFAERARVGEASRLSGSLQPTPSPSQEGSSPVGGERQLPSREGAGVGSSAAGMNSSDAAVEGARSRLRPILMTSFAMIAGMIPMALGLGEGGQQTAPLGRAVVGGLVAATVATLLVLPSVFAIVQARSHRRSASLDPEDTSNIAFRSQ